MTSREGSVRSERKELIRKYKEARRPMGVYRVRNTRTGRSLVGRSVDLSSVLNRQQAQLRFGGHPNQALQAEWKEEPDAFVFEVLDELDPVDDPGYDPTDDLVALEAMWVERLTAEGTPRY